MVTEEHGPEVETIAFADGFQKMKASDLETAQAALQDKVFRRAEELGYDTGKIEPIYDGVADAAAYFDAKQRLMWILKEPYDDWDDDGTPCGGGWTFFRDVAKGKTLAQVANGNPALRNVAYASRAILGGIGSYSELPWISDAPTDYERTLRSIAFANVGKMPAGRMTSDERLFACYEQWKDILFEQIELYDPDILVFGNTLQCFATDMGIDLSAPVRKIVRGGSTVDIHVWRGKRVLWAPHPAAHVPPEEWVDSVIEAARGPLIPAARSASAPYRENGTKDEPDMAARSSSAPYREQTSVPVGRDGPVAPHPANAARPSQKVAPEEKSGQARKTAAATAYTRQNNPTNTQQNESKTRSSTMSQVHANPDEIRDFAARLQACDENISEELSSTTAALAALGDTWDDVKSREFAEAFGDLQECIRRFSEACEEQVPHLLRLAEHLDEANSVSF